MMRVAARELEGALGEREERREPVSGVEFVRVQGIQGLRGAGVLQGVRAMAARVYAGEDWYVQDGGGTGRIECLYERARSGVGDVKFVVARLTAEDRWASDGRRAARADVEQGGLTTRGEGRAAPERSAVGGVGGSAEVDADHSLEKVGQKWTQATESDYNALRWPTAAQNDRNSIPNDS